MSAFEQQISRMNDLGDYALQELRSAKTDNAKVVLSFSETQRIVIENKEFTLAQTINSESLALMAYKNRKKGSSSINATEKDAVKKAVVDAVSLTDFGIEDENLCVAVLEKAPKANKLDFLFDKKLSEIKMEDLADLGSAAMKVLNRDSRLAIDRCEFSSSVSFSGMRNSKGVKQQELQTQLSWSFFGMAREGEEVTGFDYDGESHFHWHGAEIKVTDLAEKFAEKLLKSLRPVPCPSYRGLVLFSPRAVEEMLVPFILFHASGSAIMDGKSRWQGQLGELVADARLTLTDKPHCEYLAGASSFDRDGLPTFEKTIIENGILKSYLLDCYSAKKLKLESNGCAGGPFGIHMQPGKDSLDGILKSQKNLLLVDRFSGNSDPIKGDISGVAKSSRLFSNGVDSGAVSETMIAGNLFEMLKNVVSISQETSIVNSDGVFPYVLIDQMSVTGNI